MSDLIPPEEYFNILSKTKLTCVDLIIRNSQGQVLLGYRTNKPAQNSWFVPGGAIKKAETIHGAFKRVAQNELGVIPEAEKFFALAEHNYPDNFADKPDVESNFIVLGYEGTLGENELNPDAQHEALKWWEIDDLLASDEVHPFTKAYFQQSPPSDVIIFRL